MAYTKYDGTAAKPTPDSTASFGGASGAETLAGTAGADAFWIGQGDKAAGGAGDDTYWVQAPIGQFTITELAGAGVDRIVGWQSISLERFANIENVLVNGDSLYAAGNAMDNVVEGGDGGQQLYGGLGQDVLVGGAGADVFVVYKGEGNDVVQDFNALEDKVRLKAGFTSFDQVKASMSQVGADVKLDLGGGDGLIFRNITVGQFTAANFQLQLDPSKLGAQTFGDEFNGPLSIWDPESNPTGVWRPDLGYQGTQGFGSYTLAGNNELQIYTSPYFRDHPGDFAESPFVSNADGTLSIWAKPSTNPEIFGFGYTSGLITTKESFTQTYGYFEMRADVPLAAGAWPAFWLIPADGSWPPEFDIMETLSKDPFAAYQTEHSGIGGHSSNGVMSFVPGDGMHTYGALWSPTDLVWYIDGVEVFRTATPADMNKPMFMLANLALGGWGGTVDGAQLPAEFKIDYIRAWSLGSPGTPVSPPPPVVSPPPPVVSPPPPIVSPPPPPPPVAGDGGVMLAGEGTNLTLTGGGGCDTLCASQGYDVLTGGAAADRFVFANEPWAPITIKDFQLGTDILDLKALFTAAGYAGADPFADRYMIFESDGAGGTKLLWDRDGAGTGQLYPNYIAHLEGVATPGLTWAQLSGQPASPPPPPVVSPPPPPPPPVSNEGQVLSGTGTNLTLTGAAGGDTLYASQGYDLLTGGEGGDRFVFAQEPWAPITIKDFQIGTDLLDLKALFVAAGYSGSDPIGAGYMRFQADGANTLILWDRDAAGTAQQWPNYIIKLENVATDGLTWAKLSQPAGQVISGTGTNLTLTGSLGADTIYASQGYDVITGGAGADRFVFAQEPWAPITIKDFELGSDRLDLTALFKAAGYAGSDPLGDGYMRFQADGANTLLLWDRDAAGTAQQWPNYIIKLENVATGGLTWEQLSGQPLSPPPPPPPPPNLVLTSPGTYATLTGGAGDDTIHASQGYDVLTGGAGADKFVFAKEPWAPIDIKDFKLGVDTLDLSALFKASGYRGIDPVADKYISFESDGAGGTKLLFDRDSTGTAQKWPNYIVYLEGVPTSGLTWAKLSGAMSLTSSKAGGDVLVGGSGVDTLTAGLGPDLMTGGAGADRFVFSKLPTTAGHITDFQHADDYLDLRGLFKAAGYKGSNPVADGYLKIVSDGADGSVVMFDQDGKAAAFGWKAITTLDHVNPSTLTSADWLFR